MIRIFQIVLVYFVGMLQGIVMVMVPAAGSLLTNGHYHDLSPSEYGALFIPMIFGAVAASLAGGNIAVRRGLKVVFLRGLVLNFMAMAIFASTNLLFNNHLIDYVVLLISLLALGMGFGGTLTILNTFVVKFFPNSTSMAMTAMHALLGTGTAIAPLLLNGFLDLGFWWGAPFVVALSFIVVFIFSFLILEEQQIQIPKYSFESYKFPPIFWLFVVFACLYGIVETVFGNWATIYMTEEKNLTIKQAGLALAFFWGFVTAGRLLVSVGSFWILPRRIFIVLPLLIACAFFLIPESYGVVANISSFAFAGLACSACLPLSISFGEMKFIESASVVSGRMIASYMIGYGIAAYGVGVLHEWFDISLASIYFMAIIPALLAWVVVIFLWRKKAFAS